MATGSGSGSGIGIAVIGVGPFPWGAAQDHEIADHAAEFKRRGDMAGVHLCAVVEWEVAKWREKAAGAAGAAEPAEWKCPVLVMFYSALVLSRVADGADHALAHILMPRVQELLVAAKAEADLAALKQEVGITD